jgi:hypothetical protein
MLAATTLTEADPLRASLTVICHSATFTLVAPAAALTVHNFEPDNLIFHHLIV